MVAFGGDVDYYVLTRCSKGKESRVMQCRHLVSLVVCLGGVCLGQTPGWVVIPIPEYSAIRAKAYPVDREVEPPRMDATLTRVDYDLKLDGAIASGRAALTVDVLKDGWVRVP